MDEKTSVLLSIKPKYVKLILNNSKKFEFRKKIFKRKDIQDIIIYSSSPERKIVGKFKIGYILRETPENLWDLYQNSAGISKRNFFEYFIKKEYGFAIEIKNLEVFSEKIDPHKIFPNFHPPQSFCYLYNFHKFDTSH